MGIPFVPEIDSVRTRSARAPDEAPPAACRGAPRPPAIASHPADTRLRPPPRRSAPAPVAARLRPAAMLVALALAPAAQAQPPPAGDPAAAETAAARRVFEARLPAFRRAAPDEVLDQLRRRATALVARLPSFDDPGSRMVDLMVERPWPALRRRCPTVAAAGGGAPLAAEGALALADDMLREGRVARRATTPEDRGTLAAMLAALDGRLCRCADRPSLALAADCAS